MEPLALPYTGELINMTSVTVNISPVHPFVHLFVYGDLLISLLHLQLLRNFLLDSDTLVEFCPRNFRRMGSDLFRLPLQLYIHMMSVHAYRRIS